MRGTNTKIKSVSSQFLPAKRRLSLSFCQWEGYLLVSGIPIFQVSYDRLWVSQVALVVKNPPANAGDVRDVGSIPGWGRCPGGGNGNSLQFLPGESHGQRSLVGYSPWGHKRVRHD